MSHSDQNRYAAALYSELHQPHAIGKREMQELARRAQQRDSIHTRRRKKVHQL